MCNLHSLKRSQDEIRLAFAVATNADRPPLPTIFPNTVAPVIHLRGSVKGTSRRPKRRLSDERGPEPILRRRRRALDAAGQLRRQRANRHGKSYAVSLPASISPQLVPRHDERRLERDTEAARRRFRRERGETSQNRPLCLDSDVQDAPRRLLVPLQSLGGRQLGGGECTGPFVLARDRPRPIASCSTDRRGHIKGIQFDSVEQEMLFPIRAE